MSHVIYSFIHPVSVVWAGRKNEIPFFIFYSVTCFGHFVKEKRKEKICTEWGFKNSNVILSAYIVSAITELQLLFVSSNPPQNTEILRGPWPRRPRVTDGGSHSDLNPAWNPTVCLPAPALSITPCSILRWSFLPALFSVFFPQEYFCEASGLFFKDVTFESREVVLRGRSTRFQFSVLLWPLMTSLIKLRETPEDQ